MFAIDFKNIALHYGILKRSRIELIENTILWPSQKKKSANHISTENSFCFYIKPVVTNPPEIFKNIQYTIIPIALFEALA